MKTASLFALICVLNSLSAKEFPFYILTDRSDSTDSSKLTADNLLLGAERVAKHKFVKCRLTDKLGEPIERTITLAKSQTTEKRMSYQVKCEVKAGEKKHWKYNSFEYDEFFGLSPASDEKGKAQLPAYAWVLIVLGVATVVFGGLVCLGCICKPELPKPMFDEETPEESGKSTSFNLHIEIDENELSRGEFSTGEYENALLNMKGINQMQEDFDAKMLNSSTVDIIPSAVPNGQTMLAEEIANDQPEEQNKTEPTTIDTVDSIHSTIRTINNIFDECDDRSSSIFSAGK